MLPNMDSATALMTLHNLLPVDTAKHAATLKVEAWCKLGHA
jgi:hypothetical protein